MPCHARPASSPPACLISPYPASPPSHRHMSHLVDALPPSHADAKLAASCVIKMRSSPQAYHIPPLPILLSTSEAR
ncbi:hypothetical protein L226DRAFT_529618 [Lentinus tigrinus ALCF2SS1-7]|uniref:uncharacterized protein n=1 Tax=Lentinus tigrinus ALCF2SS1-7 TaxID=1328758 RepID=UPI0011660E99|nr:hypothetical protein L226DRAFT_529618 [Lentinus tigrinus ALCF2SS1-7]